MDFKFRFLGLSALLFVMALLVPSGISAQIGNESSTKFKNAQEVYAQCGGSDYDERRGAAVLVNRLSDSAIEVYVAMGSTKNFRSIVGFGKLEIFVQPLKKLGTDQKNVTLFEIGQPASITSNGKSFSKSDNEMIYTPKFTIPIEKEASAVRVRINGLFGEGKVTTLTTNIDGENSAGACSMSKYSDEK